MTRWEMSGSCARITVFRNYKKGPESDPLFVRSNKGASRVVRGGSWSSSAALVRAAYRYDWHPGLRRDYVGFRCLSSPEAGKPSKWAISESPSSRSGAEQTAIRDSPRIAIGAKSSSRDFELPNWAHTKGQDEFGIWVEIKLGDATQRMRWICGGTFMMGANDEDEDAYAREKPQHSVGLTNGFWMFDTPVTQSLWETIMGTGESHFSLEGPLRPVESISYERVQKFLSRLNRQLPGLELTLPTEAEWEYACRAGTTSTQYGKLDSIAWYQGNSKGSTQIVKSKLPNRWGLYDTLGNVWEWCRDSGMRDYGQTPVFDPRGLEKPNSRALRGGGWESAASIVRASCRRSWSEFDKSFHVGFRCISYSLPKWALQKNVQKCESLVHKSENRQTNVSHAHSLRIVSQQVPRWSLETDRERLTIERSAQPEWASRSGRDRYGLWAELEVQENRATPALDTPRPFSHGGITERKRKI